MAGQVGADGLPTAAQISAAEHHVAGHEQRLRVMGREHDGIGPLEAVPHVPGAPSGVELGPHRDDPHLSGGMVIVQQVPAAAGRAANCAGDHRVGIVRVQGDVAAFGVAHHVAVAPGYGSLVRAGRHADGGVVLLGAVHSVGKAVVRGQVVELGRELVVDAGPGLAAVEADAGPAVVALDHPQRVVGVDPEVVVVAVGRGDPAEVAPSVHGLPARVVEDPHRVRVLRIGEDVLVVPGPPLQIPVVADQLPGFAPIVRAVQSAVFGLNSGPHPPGLGGGNGDADASLEAAGQARLVGDFGPGVATVHGLEDAAALSAADEAPGRPPGLPDGGVQDARVVGVHGQVHGPGVLAAEQDTLPVGSAVFRAEHAPLVVGAVGVPQGCHVHQVGIGGMHPHPGDVPGVGQADVGPGLAAVGGTVHPVPVGHVPADAGFPHAGIDDVGVGGRDGDGAHRGGVEVPIGDVLPVGAAVGGLPHPPGARSEVEDHGIDRVAGDRHHPAAPGRADAAPTHRAQQLLRNGGGRGLVLPRCTRRHRRTSGSRSAPAGEFDCLFPGQTLVGAIIPLRNRACRGDTCAKASGKKLRRIGR